MPHCRVDAWAVLRPNNPGYTYDGERNKMVGNTYRSRLDRIVGRLEGWEAANIELVGINEINGVFWKKRMGRRTVKMPTWPSDHYGALKPLNA